jgi:hypothetical protein
MDKESFPTATEKKLPRDKFDTTETTDPDGDTPVPDFYCDANLDKPGCQPSQVWKMEPVYPTASRERDVQQHWDRVGLSLALSLSEPCQWKLTPRLGRPGMVTGSITPAPKRYLKEKEEFALTLTQTSSGEGTPYNHTLRLAVRGFDAARAGAAMEKSPDVVLAKNGGSLQVKLRTPTNNDPAMFYAQVELIAYIEIGSITSPICGWQWNWAR